MMNKTFGAAQFSYNKILKRSEIHFKNTGKHLLLYPSQLKEEFPFLEEVDSLALVGAHNSLRQAYRGYFSKNGNKLPRLKTRGSKNKSYRTYKIKAANNIYLKDGILRLPKVGLLKIAQHIKIPESYKIKSVTVSAVPSGRYFASINFEFEEQITPVEPKRILGLDYSINSLFVTSEGHEFGDGFVVSELYDALLLEREKLKSLCRGSNNYHKQYQRIHKVMDKIKNVRTDRFRKKIFELSENYDCVVVETLSMKEYMKNPQWRKKVKAGSYFSFVSMLEKKMTSKGKRLIKIDKWYPSSKTCSCCGAIKQNLSMNERVYRCDACDNVMHRDINAAINIKNFGIQTLKEEASRTC